ncbi:uncharacterized protein [Linepithema humile]|uniref:uncharacterized protein n=1 Tax=Linepithema humile TaxID=83485 RepID=UPI0006231C5D|nr:PREDICTED: uncharacterized protein LOC105677446 [Linepithema humile]
MSNIFKLLGEIAEPDRSQAMNPILRSKTFHEIKLNKGMGGTKPKGLSIRSNSDMNISHSPHLGSAKKNIYDNKEQDCMKLKVTQLDNRGCPVSPGRKTLGKKLTSQPVKFKESLKEGTPIMKDTKSQKTLNDGIFKKPSLPKKNVKKFREPEKLAYWYDAQEEFDHGYIETIEKEFKNLLSKEKENIKPNKKEKLVSDPEMLVFSNIPKLVLDKSFEDYKKLSPVDLPEMSDLSDIDNL